MKNSGLISVIVPVYNVEKYLRECIESVLAQTHQNWEMILVDDGSEDSSGEICDEYAKKDNRILVIHQENQGLSGARNTGFENAKGEYVYFLDSDDWIVPEAIELMCQKLTEEVDVIFFEALSFEDGKAESATEKGYSYKQEYKTDSGLSILSQLQENKEYHSAVPLLFIRKQYMEDIHLRFETGILYEDMLFTYELFCQAKRVAQLKKHFYMRRYRSNSIMTSRKTKRNFISAYTVYEKVRDASCRLGIIDEKFAKQYIIRCAFNVFNYYKALNKENRRECLMQYKKFRQNVLENKAHGNKALHMRCYGYVPWVIYKVYSKIRGI